MPYKFELDHNAIETIKKHLCEWWRHSLSLNDKQIIEGTSFGLQEL